MRALAIAFGVFVCFGIAAEPARSLTPTQFEQFEAANAKVGAAPGERLPEFQFWGPDGARQKPADLRGKVVFFHFWGAWCPPCRRELPQLADLYARYRDRSDGIAFVFVTIGEPLSTTQAFVDKGGKSLPLYESGSSKGDRKVTLVSGERERVIDHLNVRVYPATILLDRNGIVTWRHAGERNDWLDVAPAIDALISRPR